MKKRQLSVEAYARDNKAMLATGKLITLDNQIDQTTGTLKFKSQFDNQDMSLWPNQFVNVRLYLERQEGRHRGFIRRDSEGRTGFLRLRDRLEQRRRRFAPCRWISPKAMCP